MVVGTRNRKKGAELRELLAPWGLEVVTLDDFPIAIDVVEDGDSFAANAVLKASQQARHLGRWVLADDSGLEVDALGGAPGIYSARFAGANSSDEQNNSRLLERLGDTPLEKRTAVLKEAEIFGARVVDSSIDGFALEATGDAEKLDEFIDIMRSYGEFDIARSGVVAMSLRPKKPRLSPPVPTRDSEAVEQNTGVLNG